MAAGGSFGETSENPVGINVTALVDVLLCLCMFFMSVIHFQWDQDRIETWLPRDSHGPYWHGHMPLDEIRVFIRWDPSTERVLRKVGNRAPVADDDELMSILRGIRQDHAKAGCPDSPILIDAMKDVPWEAVVHVVDLCKLDGIGRIEFEAPPEFH